MSVNPETTTAPAIETNAAPTAEVLESKPAAESAPNPPSEKPSEKPIQAAPSTPLAKLFAELPVIIKDADHKEIWGVELSDDSHVPTTIVLEKFLRANSKDVTKAKAQLIEALKWRKKVQPAKLLADTEFDATKYGGLGFVTVYPKTDTRGKEIITWNIYGAVKDNKATFGNVEEFVKWRAALMELSVKELDLASATEKIPENGIDPYRMVQVHDYLNVSFLRMDPTIKAASTETIKTFSMAYPELLKEKFFVNVPVLMGWVFAAMKLFLSPDTIKKFHPLSYGSSLAGELSSFGQELPTAYGGKGKDVKDGLTVKYASPEAAEPVKSVEEITSVKEVKPAEAVKPVDTTTPVEAVPPTEPTKSVDENKPPTEPTPAKSEVGSTKPLEDKLAETKLADETKPAESEAVAESK